MRSYDVRFWDKTKREMIYGAGLSPNQLPIIKHDNGTLEELQGTFVPMICTQVLSSDKKPIWEGDIIECDIQITLVEGMSPAPLKAYGIMQYNNAKGLFSVNIHSKPEEAGKTFQVTNSRVIGDILSSPEFLKGKTITTI